MRSETVSPLWRIPLHVELSFAEYDDGVVVHEARSNATHRLDPSAGCLLSALCKAGQSTADTLASGLDAPVESVLIALAQLSDVDLVECAEGT